MININLLIRAEGDICTLTCSDVPVSVAGSVDENIAGGPPCKNIGLFSENIKNGVDTNSNGCYNIQAFAKAPLAQLVEHMTFNHGVRSSTLRWSSMPAFKAGFFIVQLVDNTSGQWI